jgi:hypothetical protein
MSLFKRSERKSSSLIWVVNHGSFHHLDFKGSLGAILCKPIELISLKHQKKGKKN